MLGAFKFHRKDNRATQEDHELGVVVKVSLAGEKGAPVAKKLCRRLMAATAKDVISGYDYDDLVRALLMVHPFDILDELFAGDTEAQRASVRLLNDLLRFHRNVLDTLSDEIVLTWCDRDPTARYPLAASVVVLFNRPKEGESHEWTPLTGKLLENAPNPLLVLNEIVNRLHPTSWSGSFATKLEERLRLLLKLPGGDAPILAEAIIDARTKLQEYIAVERRSEQETDRAENNRFE